MGLNFSVPNELKTPNTCICSDLQIYSILIHILSADCDCLSCLRNLASLFVVSLCPLVNMCCAFAPLSQFRGRVGASKLVYPTHVLFVHVPSMTLVIRWLWFVAV